MQLKGDGWCFHTKTKEKQKFLGRFQTSTFQCKLPSYSTKLKSSLVCKFGARYIYINLPLYFFLVLKIRKRWCIMPKIDNIQAPMENQSPHHLNGRETLWPLVQCPGSNFTFDIYKFHKTKKKKWVRDSGAVKPTSSSTIPTMLLTYSLVLHSHKFNPWPIKSKVKTRVA